MLPYIDHEPEGEGLPANLPFYPPLGDDAWDAVLEEWTLGREVGFVDQVPYSEKLAHGYSPQAAEGWVEVITEEANQLPDSVVVTSTLGSE